MDTSMMLYGIGNANAGLQNALTAAPRHLAALPEPFRQAYTLAQEADAAGDTVGRTDDRGGDRRHPARATKAFQPSAVCGSGANTP